MNILFVSTIYSHLVQAGGPAVKVPAMAEGLAKRGHSVVVLTVSHGQRELEKRFTESVQITYLHPWLRYRASPVALGAIPFCMRRLEEFEVVHIYGLYELLGPITGFFCRRRRIPYVLEPLGMSRPVGRSVGKKRLYKALLGKRLMEQAVLIIATSDVEKQMLLEDGIGKEKIILRRNGIDMSQFEPLPPSGRFRASVGIGVNDKVVLFLGRMAPVKNLDMLLEAFATLPNRGSQLVLIGPDERDGYVDRLRALGRSLGLNGRLLVLGPIYGAAKVEALADSDVFVLPSRSESFGMAALEAMACGKPVVVTETCGIAQYVKDRAGLVVRQEPKAIAEGVRTILEHPETAQRFGQTGRAIAAQLSWDGPVAQMENLYAKLASRPGPSVRSSQETGRGE